MAHSRLAVAAAGTVGALVLTACSATPTTGDGLTIAASFYPLQYVAEHVAGEDATILALAQPGVEPHDLELSPSAVRQLDAADLVLYLSDFQPAVDDAIASTSAPAFDAAGTLALHEADEHAEDEPDEHGHGANDPHFWLDPTLLASYATAVGDQLAELDPANAESYSANAAAFAAELAGLDEEFATGLAQCERREIFVSHEAFGYLAERYDLTQVGIAGIDPESEPSPARLLEIRSQVEDSGATTIFTESLLNPAVADSIARDTGASTAVLDPVETVVGDDDYADVMARNLDALRTALACD